MRASVARAAIAVVKRSSYISTGTATRAGQAVGEGARLARLVGVGAAEAEWKAHDDPLDAPVADEFVTRAKPRRVAGRSIGSIGVARVPVGSLSAHPQRALP